MYILNVEHNSDGKVPGCRSVVDNRNFDLHLLRVSLSFFLFLSLSIHQTTHPSSSNYGAVYLIKQMTQ
jgi:hypothetical protein